MGKAKLSSGFRFGSFSLALGLVVQFSTPLAWANDQARSQSVRPEVIEDESGRVIYRSNPGDQFKGACHPFVRQLVQEDKESLSALIVRIQSQYKSCRVHTTPEKLKETFSGGSDQFNQFLRTDRFAGLGNNNQFDQNGCQKISLKDSHEVASKFYYLSGRAEQAQVAAAAQVASIDRVLGDQDTLGKLDCAKAAFGDVQKVCSEAKNCARQEKPLDTLAKKTELNLKLIAGLVSDIESLSKKMTALSTPKEEKEDIHVQMMWYRNQIQIYKAQTPWVDGTDFQRARNLRVPMDAAIKRQMQADRKNAIETYIESEKLHRCLKGNTASSDNCSFEQTENLLAKTHHLPDFWNPKADQDTKSKIFYSNLELSAQQCLVNTKSDQVKTASTIRSAVVEGALLT